MNQRERIEKDLTMFEERLEKIDLSRASKIVFIAVAMAKQYHSDAKYYLEKKDYFTAFGCINYAHGLLDAHLKIKNKKEKKKKG
ncbi:MAG TPA: DUF357 domain-containing protein [Holosporales bacterium]|nr:DUF357 domain-containing protein [Holosporales bacterium]